MQVKFDQSSNLKYLQTGDDGKVKGLQVFVRSCEHRASLNSKCN